MNKLILLYALILLILVNTSIAEEIPPAPEPDVVREVQVVKDIKVESEFEEKGVEKARSPRFWNRILYWFMHPSGKVSFSETNGEVRDNEGNVIADAKIGMSSFCNAGHFSTEYNLLETTTDNNGRFEFGASKIKTFLPAKYCKKVIFAYKDGYCAYSRRIDYSTCLRELSRRNFSFSNIDIYFIRDTVTIKAKELEVSHILKDVSGGVNQEELDALEEEIRNTPLTALPKE